ESRQVSLYHQGYVWSVFAEFNAVHRQTLSRDFGLDLAPLPEPEFRRFIGAGQASLEHLAKFIHDRLLPLMQQLAAALRHELLTAALPERAEIRQQLSRLRDLDTDEIAERFLKPGKNPTLTDPGVPPAMAEEDPKTPALLRLAPQELTARLQAIHAVGRITLSLGNMRVEDVLEVLYDCRGAVTHLEIVNMKDRAQGKEIDPERINALQEALNTANVIKLKKLIRSIISSVGSRTRREKLSEILYDISTLRSCYLKTPLASCIGTDSTGQSSRLHGMGMVVVDTLPARARRALAGMTGAQGKRLDVTVSARRRVSDLPEDEREPRFGLLHGLAAAFAPLRVFTRRKGVEWLAENYHLTPGIPGNVSLMGG
ncbi:MAG: hypothetical protein C0405_14455, partial [Desulfovibrio sp.]|nr:hypothetical protein [Desulfovibrio sp.]